jgi:nucleoside-diphosphate-sugar epimerase
MHKVLITGGSGFIGRYFIEKLQGKEIVNLDLREPDFQSDARFVQGDIRNSELVKQALGNSDTLIHLAAMHHDFGIADEAYFDTNVGGAMVLIAAAEAGNVKQIIFFSSVAVYGDKGNPGPTTELTEPAPTSPYGHSKLQAERAFEEWAHADPTRKLIVVRSTVVFGAHNLANVLNLIKAIDQGLYFHVGKGDAIKSLGYVENIVDASLFAVEKTKSGVFLFNYVDYPQQTNRAIADLQAGMLGRKIRLRLPLWFAVLLAKPFDFAILLSGKNLKISSKRVKKLCTQTNHSADLIRSLGFKPAFPIDYGMRQMINWYKGSTKKD